jgi:hypothetical protein
MTLLAFRSPFNPQLQHKVNGVKNKNEGRDQDSTDKEVDTLPQDLPYPRRMI